MPSRWMPLVLASAVVACNPSPSNPSPQPNNPSALVVSGRVNATATGQPHGGATIDLGGTVTTTGADGTFRHELPRNMSGSIAPVKISGPGLLERALWLTVSTREITLDAVALGSGFSLDYYRMIARDSLASPGTFRSLRRWAAAPRLYVKTVDEAGMPIDAVTLETVIAAFQDESSAWTGGRFGLAAVERGTETREAMSGWLTVKWPAAASAGLCGRAQIAVNGGWIELYYQNPNCACRGSRIDPGTARHELGHAMGFYHTNDPADAMFPGGPNCDDHPSARERLHAAIAYSRPFGNTDPDNDPTSSVTSAEAPPVVDN